MRAIQPDMFGGPEIEGEAYRPDLIVWDWGGVLFPPTDDEVRQYKLLRADTLTAEESAGLDRMAAASRRCTPLDRAKEHFPGSVMRTYGRHQK